MNMNLSYILMDARQYERSITVRDMTLELQPDLYDTIRDDPRFTAIQEEAGL